MTDTTLSKDQASKDQSKAAFDPNKLECHPLAEAFEPMKGLEFDAFKADVQKNGLLHPIVLYDGKILDGRNRYRAMIAAGKPFNKEKDFKVYTGFNPAEYVISANVNRRHLTDSQRAMHGARLVQNKLGANQHNRSLSAADAANLVGVSETMITNAKAILEKASDEVLTALKIGNLKVGAIKTEDLTLPKAEQLNTIQQRKEDAKAKAAETRKANKGNGAPKANQDFIVMEAFIKQWTGFDGMQRRVFVEKCRTDISAILQEMERREKLSGAPGASPNLGSLQQNPN
jgi:hypothetical protein